MRTSRVEWSRGSTDAADGVELAVAASSRLLARLSIRPAMIVDARPASMRDRATATYGLVAALGMRRVCPLSAQVAGAGPALSALSFLIAAAAVDDGAPLLVVTGCRSTSSESGGPLAVAVLAIARDTGRCAPEMPLVVSPGRASLDVRGRDNGFYEFAVEVDDGAERCLRDGVDRIATESLVIRVEEMIDDATARR
jgi:hypothetical protein